MITRPFSLALRLFCNIFVGEILVGVMLGICAYVLPLPVMFFEVFVAFVQALVFMMLTIAYVSMSVNEEH
jgi:F-type H+-transporting ATPase subunit a